MTQAYYTSQQATDDMPINILTTKRMLDTYSQLISSLIAEKLFAHFADIDFNILAITSFNDADLIQKEHSKYIERRKLDDY